jgi:hypothetical protein
MSHNAGDNPFWGLSERQRLEMALTNIVQARSMGRFVSIEAEVRKAGHQSEAKFWMPRWPERSLPWSSPSF